MSIVAPVRTAMEAGAVVSPIGGGLPWEGGGVVPILSAPSQVTAPSLAGSLATGAVITITPAIWAGGTSRPQSRVISLKRAGVEIGTYTYPFASPLTYTEVAADSGAAMTVVETATNPIGSTASDASNAITVPVITTWTDQVGGVAMTAAIGGEEPAADSRFVQFGSAKRLTAGLGRAVGGLSGVTVLTRGQMNGALNPGDVFWQLVLEQAVSTFLLDVRISVGGYQEWTFAARNTGGVSVGVAGAGGTSDTVRLWTEDGAGNYTARIAGVAATVVASGATGAGATDFTAFGRRGGANSYAHSRRALWVVYDGVLSGANQAAAEALAADLTSTLAQYQALGTVLAAWLPGVGWT